MEMSVYKDMYETTSEEGDSGEGLGSDTENVMDVEDLGIVADKISSAKVRESTHRDNNRDDSAHSLSVFRF